MPEHSRASCGMRMMCRRRLSISGGRCTVFSSNGALPFVFVRALAAGDQRGAITEAFISVVRDYNDYQEQLNNTDAKLNAFILNGFARQFTSGEKTAKGYGDNPDVFVLPALKEAMKRIIEGVSEEALALAKAIGHSPELMELLKGLIKNQ